jgi:Ca-activated chloride channel homolog
MTWVPLLSALALLAQPAAPPPAAPPPAAPPPEAPVLLRVQKTKPALLDGARRALLRTARRLWERDEPAATEGNALVGQNDVPGALKAYDAAEKQVPKPSDAAAALALNRSGALLKLGAEEAPQAFEQAVRALASTDPPTRAKAAYDAALALESTGKTDEAIGAYGRALALDPDDEDAKVNLELLLRGEERKKKQPGMGPQDEQKKQQQKGDSQQSSQAKGDAAKKDEQPAPGEPKKSEEKPQGQPKPQDDQKRDSGQKQAQQEKKEQQESRGGQGEEKQPEQPKRPEPGDPGKQARADALGGGAEPLDRTEAQRLLDALRASEKNLQIWRFGKRPKDDARRRAAEKDW